MSNGDDFTIIHSLSKDTRCQETAFWEFVKGSQWFHGSNPKEDYVGVLEV